MRRAPFGAWACAAVLALSLGPPLSALGQGVAAQAGDQALQSIERGRALLANRTERGGPNDSASTAAQAHAPKGARLMP